MIFSFKTTIRALLAPEHRISCPRRLWSIILGELDRRGERRHEAGVFLLGVEKGGRREVKDAVFYDELDPLAYSTGACVLDGDAFANLWALCRERRLSVVADAHTHPGAAVQSRADQAHPMVARAGHVAIIIPKLAVPPLAWAALGIYEYCGEHRWTNHSGKLPKRYFYVGLWS
jgi:proteasome lid subunit RPN8/RPN11